MAKPRINVVFYMFLQFQQFDTPEQPTGKCRVSSKVLVSRTNGPHQTKIDGLFSGKSRRTKSRDRIFAIFFKQVVWKKHVMFGNGLNGTWRRNHHDGCLLFGTEWY